MADDKKWSANNPGSGGLNSDSDLQGTEPTEFPSGDYLYAINLRKGGANEVYSGGKSDIRGNLLIPNEFLPEGENTNIGAYEDTYTPSIIFANYNSEGNHGIYQYFPFQLGGENGKIVKLIESSTLAFEKHWVITGMNLEENKLFYWVQGFENAAGEIEGNPPRKINIIKANDFNKKREYQLIFDHDIFNYPGATQARIDIVIRDQNDVVVVSDQTYIPLPTDTYLDFLKAFASGIQSTYSEFLTATACNCGIDVSFIEAGEFTITALVYTISGITTTPRAIMAIPQNFYPSPILNDFLDRIKYPPLFFPTFMYKADLENKANNLVGEYFQFATRYRYDDGEKSVKGPISKLAYMALPCGVEDNQSPYNYIEVDFTSERLQDANIASVLTGVDLLVRIGTNGLWRLVKTFDRCELGVTSQTFRFFNDTNYPVLDDTIEDIQHDIPLIGMTQEFVSNRGFIEAGLESYGNIECPDGTLELTYSEEHSCEDEEMATIEGRIYVRNPHSVTDPTDALYQPIYDAGSGIVFGGMSGTFTDNAGTNYNQWLYNRGFRVYSAGTDYNVYSEQTAPAGVTILPGEGNIYDASDAPRRDAIRAAMLTGDVYSTFSLQVKAGTHIIRIASHLLQDLDNNTPYDALAASGVWQKTSSYVDDIGGTGFAEIIVTVEAGEVLNIGNCVIMDLKDTTATYSVAYSGYVIDGEGSADQEVLFASPRMERQTNFPTVGTGYFSYNNQARTDHNGFWWGTEGGLGPIPTTNNIRFLTQSIAPYTIHNTTEQFLGGNLLNLEAGTCTTITTLDVSNEHKPFIIYNTDPDISNACRTTIEGFALATDGGPAINIDVLFGATNRMAVSSAAGFYKILVYVDTFVGSRNNYLIFRASEACCADYPDGDKKWVSIFPFTLDAVYSIGFPFDAGSWLVDVIGLSVYERLKKRNKKVLGIVYSDEAGRCSKVQQWDGWEIYIPFDTEPEGNAGIATIKWKINHAPPSWAKVFHIVAAKNAIYERYEQFIIGEITYVSHINTADDEIVATTYAAGDATEIYISMETFIFYMEENSDSQVIFIPKVGDRITFKLKEDGTLFEGYFDYRILSYNGDGAATDPLTLVVKNDTELPELKPGMLVELWTPKLKTEEALFFETMDTKRILLVDGVLVHEGDERGGQNQIIGVQPAIGRLKTGDTWVYKRNMLTKDTGVDPNDKDYFLRQIESQYINDWDRIDTENPTSTSLQLQLGRPHIQDKEWMQLFHKTRIRWCGKYVNNGNTIVNDYSVFRGLHYLDLEREYGTCMRLVRIGEQAELMSIHKYKLQPLYTGFKELIDLSGDAFVGKSSEVLNAAQALVIKAGTSNPESVFVEGNYVYGWSTYHGAWWRYASNGIEIISATNPFKIQKIAQAKEEQIKGIDVKYARVFGAMHRDRSEAIWAFKGIEIGPTGEDGGEEQRVTPAITVPAETIYFDESENRWGGYYSYEPEFMVPLNSSLYSFKNGELYIHEKNPLFNNFYGVQYFPKIVIPRAMDARKEKLFYSIRILPAIGKWSCPLIEVMPSDINPNGMKSRITANRFKAFKASSWADFLRDLSDPSFVNELQALFKGRPLMGRVLLITITNNSVDGIYLNEINVSSSESNQTL